MDRNALLDHLAQEMDHWPGPGSMPEPPIKGIWTCHGEWRCYAKGDNRAIEKNDWARRRLALLSQIEKGEASKMSTTPNAPRWPEGYDQNGFRLNYGLTHQQRADALDTGICADGVRCGFGTPEHGPVYCDNCPNRPQPEPSTIEAAIDQPVNAHYQRTYRGVLLDPYRIAAVWGMQGGPREQIMKKCLRFTEKGQTEQEVVDEIRNALNRWQAMLDEDVVN